MISMIVNKAILKIARAIVTELKEMRVLSPQTERPRLMISKQS
jgi:hypothetical protein